MRQVLLLLALYIGVVMGPAVVVFLAGSGSGNAVMETGKLFALAGFMILALQFLLASRFKWIFSLMERDSRIRKGDEIVILTHSKNLPALRERWKPKSAGEEEG